MDSSLVLDVSIETPGVTFNVCDVNLATEKLPSGWPQEVMAERLGEKPLTISGYTGQLLSETTTNPLVTAAKLAYDQHRPLVLSPDVIQLTILQAVSEHIYAENLDLRDPRAESAAPVVIGVDASEIPVRSPETPWNDFLTEAASSLRESIHPDLSELFGATFSTTGPTERAIFDATLIATCNASLAIFEALAICGVPQITLLGEEDDWHRMKEQLGTLSAIGLDAWAERIEPILEQFTAAFRGAVDRDFWSGMVYRNANTACDRPSLVSGWLLAFFPFGRRYNGHVQRLDIDSANGIELQEFPSGIREIVAYNINLQSSSRERLNVHAGMIGVEQHESMALEPKLGWYVSKIDQASSLLQELAGHERCKCRPPEDTPSKRLLTRPIELMDLMNDEYIPSLLNSNELQLFYRLYGGLEVYGPDDQVKLRIYPSSKIHELEQGNKTSRVLRIGDLPDGRILGFLSYHHGELNRNFGFYFVDSVQSIIEDKPCQLVALSLADVIRLALVAGDDLLDQNLDFTSLGEVIPAADSLYDLLGISKDDS